MMYLAVKHVNHFDHPQIEVPIEAHLGLHSVLKEVVDQECGGMNRVPKE